MEAELEQKYIIHYAVKIIWTRIIKTKSKLNIYETENNGKMNFRNLFVTAIVKVITNDEELLKEIKNNNIFTICRS
jgi:hypothetical protein